MVLYLFWSLMLRILALKYSLYQAGSWRILYSCSESFLDLLHARSYLIAEESPVHHYRADLYEKRHACDSETSVSIKNLFSWLVEGPSCQSPCLDHWVLHSHHWLRSLSLSSCASCCSFHRVDCQLRRLFLRPGQMRLVCVILARCTGARRLLPVRWRATNHASCIFRRACRTSCYDGSRIASRAPQGELCAHLASRSLKVF